MKDEREILTRQLVLQKLKREAQRSMVGAFLILILGSVLFGMLSLICAVGLPKDSGILKLLPVLLFIPVFITCIFLCVRALLQMLKAQRGDFTVVKENLTEVQDNQFNLIQFLTDILLLGVIYKLSGNKSHIRHIFKFESGRQFIANVEEYKNSRLGVSAEFSLVGDSFFLVFYNDSPNKVILLFNSKTYNYKEDE